MAKRKASKLEAEFALQIRASRLPKPEVEYRFDTVRRWRFDFAWPERKIAVEVEGGTYTKGRHTRPVGFRDDCIKYNAAAQQGWTVLRGDAMMVKDLTLLKALEEVLGV